MNNMIGLSPSTLRRAADVQEQILSLQTELGQLLGNSGSAETAAPAEVPRKRKFSAAAKAKMRAAQKARWARIKGSAASPAALPEPAAKKKMSAQGLANIRAGVLKRMAAQRKTATAKPGKKASKMSAAGLANIRAGVAKRMAKQKAAKGKL